MHAPFPEATLPRKAVVFWPVVLGGLAFDQITKIWVYTNLAYRVDQIEIIPGFLSIVHAQNPGAAFGMLDDFAYRYVFFGVFTVVAFGVILDLYRRLPRADWGTALALALILAGAGGNAIDRIHKRTVTDFVRMYTEHPTWKPWLREHVGMSEWPTWNVADALLLIGVGWFFLHAIMADEAVDDMAPSSDAPDAPSA